MRKHLGWYLGHFPGAKQVRNELVRVNSLADVERIIHIALDNPQVFQNESEFQQEAIVDPELNLTCAF
jgi:tRNA-dihydrouridine synthase B